MGLDANGRKIVRCGMELLQVKEQLFEISAFEQTDSQASRVAMLEQRKKNLLSEVNALSAPPS